MWTFNVEQKRLRIGKVSVGGLPGERPTVLIGSIFYRGEKRLFKDESNGFDKRRAEELINRQEDFSERTGNPHMVDVVGTRPDSIIRSLEFVAGVTDAPILIDGVTPDVRIAALEYVKASGLQDRVVYNSITPEFRGKELEAIKDCGVKSAVLLAYNTKELTSKGRIRAIDALLPKVYDAGIENPLLDTCVLDIPSLGLACRALFDLKNRLGLPVGCGAHNAVATWRGLRGKMGEQAVLPSFVASNVIAAAVGADFIMYGPIEHAEYIFPVVAMTDAAYAQVQMERGRIPDPGHPIFRIA